MRLLAVLLSLVVATVPSSHSHAQAGAPPQPAVAGPLPARFIADVPFATPVTAGGDTLVLLLDTGGGANMLYPSALERLGITSTWERRGADSIHIANFPALAPGAAIPLPGPTWFLGDRLMVAPPQIPTPGRDGMLGRTWFADRVWRLDYLSGTIALLGAETRPSSSIDAPNQVPIGFQVDSAGRRTTHFPRIRVQIERDSLDLLLDTGASVVLTDAAIKALHEGREPRVRGTSFIARSVYERWRRQYPAWRVIEHADSVLDTPMIQVPWVRVGGHTVGPVWFTVRPDENFHEFMSQWMDRRIDGALGASALRYFRVTLDYPRAVATFER
jgi:hypothetical protein